MGEKVYFSATAMRKEGEKLWFAAREINGLFRMCMDGTGVEYLGSFPGEMEDMADLYGQCINYNKQILFPPLEAKKVIVYDTEDNCFKEILSETTEVLGNYLAAVVWRESILLFPSNKKHSNIAKINLKTGRIKKDSLWIQKVRFTERCETLFREYCIVGNKLYAPVIASDGQMIEYNLDTNEIICVQLPFKGNYKAICHDKDNIYLCSLTGNVLIKRNIGTGQTEKNLLDIPDNMRINTAICQNGYIFLFSHLKIDSDLPDMVIGYNVKTGETLKLIQAERDFTERAVILQSSTFATAEDADENRIWAMNAGNGILYEIETDTLAIKKHLIERIDIEAIYRQKFMQKSSINSTFLETSKIPNELNLFLDSDICAGGKIRTKCRYGDDIWHHINENM